MITFKKETNERYTTWTAPVVNDRIVYIKERHSCKGAFDLFVNHQIEENISPDSLEYIETFDDISKAKISAREAVIFIEKFIK